jgi:serine/threonine protein kinase
MEYAGNVTLKQYIENHIKTNVNQFMEEEKVKNIVKQICLGLKEIHDSNIIHRDLKPENIFIDKDSIKIGDFGISKKLSFNDPYCKSTVGTYNYMAPEILNGEKYNNKVDIWAFGCIIYELLTLERCFEDESIFGLINKIVNQNYKKLYINKENELSKKGEENFELLKNRKEYKEYKEYQDLIDKLLKKNYKERIDIFTLYQYLFDKIVVNKNGKHLSFKISIGNSLLEYLNYLEPKYLNEITELDLDKTNIIDIRNIGNVKFTNLEILNLNDNKICDISPLERVNFKKLKKLELFINEI